MILHTAVSDKKFIALMASSYEDDIYKKIPEQDIFKLYLDVKYGQFVTPEGTVTKIVRDFIHHLVDARLKYSKTDYSI